jgi:hypothetical protein
MNYCRIHAATGQRCTEPSVVEVPHVVGHPMPLCQRHYDYYLTVQAQKRAAMQTPSRTRRALRRVRNTLLYAGCAAVLLWFAGGTAAHWITGVANIPSVGRDYCWDAPAAPSPHHFGYRVRGDHICSMADVTRSGGDQSIWTIF